MRRKHGIRSGIRDGVARGQDEAIGDRRPVPAESLEDGAAGEEWQVQIADDEVETLATGSRVDKRGCRFAVFRFHDEPLLALKPSFERKANAGFVINNQYTRHGRSPLDGLRKAGVR